MATKHVSNRLAEVMAVSKSVDEYLEWKEKVTSIPLPVGGRVRSHLNIEVSAINEREA